jgi:hypothetical protein
MTAATTHTSYPPATWERMIRAVEKVRERLERAVAALEAAAIPYAVAGGNAVAAWVARVDEAAVRNTRDVDIVLRRDDLPAATEALRKAGFIFHQATGVTMFLDSAEAKARDAVHVVFGEEKIRKNYLLPAPSVDESESVGPFRALTLDALVRMKLTSFRDKDRMHLRDMLDVGLIDDGWCKRFPQELADRLREIIANPED